MVPVTPPELSSFRIGREPQPEGSTGADAVRDVLDDDDILKPDHLASLAQNIGTGRPELLFTDFKIRYEDRTTFPPLTHSTQAHTIADVDAASVFVLDQIPNNSLVYRRDLLADIRIQRP